MENNHKEWFTIRTSREFASFLENEIAPKRRPEQNSSKNGIVDEALNVFVTHPNREATRHDFSLRATLSNVFFINDPNLDKYVKIEIKKNRLYCHYHKFIETECPHTIWASMNKAIEKILPKPIAPFSNSENKIAYVRVRKKLFAKFNRITKDQRKALHCSESDMLMKIVLNYYS